MLDSILSSAKGDLLNQLGSKFNLTPDQAGKTVDAAKKTVADGLANEMKSGNISGLTGLLNGKSPAGSNPIAGGMVQNLVTTLVQKVGLNQQMAASISNFVIPFLLGKIGGSKPGGFKADDLTSMLGGGGIADKIKEGIGGIGKMFGK